MDPREKREDESWAEYGARMASMGIAPEVAAVPLAAGIRRPGRRGPRTLTPDQIAVRDANRLKVENQQLSRNIQRIAAEETPVQSRQSASAVKRGDTSAQEADDLRRKEQAAIEKQTRVGGKVVKAVAPFLGAAAKWAGIPGAVYSALESKPTQAQSVDEDISNLMPYPFQTDAAFRAKYGPGGYTGDPLAADVTTANPLLPSYLGGSYLGGPGGADLSDAQKDVMTHLAGYGIGDIAYRPSGASLYNNLQQQAYLDWANFNQIPYDETPGRRFSRVGLMQSRDNPNILSNAALNPDSSYYGLGTGQQVLMDMINNQIIEESIETSRKTPGFESTDEAITGMVMSNPNLILDTGSLAAAVKLADENRKAIYDEFPRHIYNENLPELQEAKAAEVARIAAGLPEMVSQVDTFADMPGMLDAQTQAQIDADVATGMLDVNDLSMAQVGGIPSGRTFGVAAPVSGSPSMNVDYSAALRAVTPSLTYGGVPADSTDPQTYFGEPIPPPGKERQEEIKRLREKYLESDDPDLPIPDRIIIAPPYRWWEHMPDPNAPIETSLPNFSIIDQAMADTQITPSEDVNLAGMPFADVVTGAEALINEAPFVSANPLSVLAKTGMMSNLVNYDAGPAVQEVFDTIMPTVQAAPAQPAGPSAADIERQKQAAINARLAQEATARQQQQQAAAVQQAIEFERMEKRLANLQGRDRADPSEIAALEVALGSYRGDPVGRQVGRNGGGFDPQGGTTGSSGMGAWT